MSTLFAALRNNWGYKLLSIGLALLLWTYVQNVENPVDVRRLPITVQIKNLPADLYVFWEEPGRSQVQATIRDRKDRVVGVMETDLRAEIDLRDAVPGTRRYRVRVAVSQNTLLRPESVQIVPASVTLRVEPVSSMAKRIDVMADPPEGTRWTVLPAVEPADVIIRGPRSSLEKVRAVARVDARTRPTPPSGELRLEKVLVTVETDKGATLPGLVWEPTEVLFRGNLKEVNQSRIFPVTAVIRGTPAQGFRQIGGIEVEPSHVLVSGTEDLMGFIDSLKTEVIDISGATGTLRRTARVQIRSDLRLTGSDRVRVTIPIERDVSGGLPQPAPEGR